jgi:hypothetical protein
MDGRGNGQEIKLRRTILKRILGMLGLALLLAALLTVFVTGSLLAASDNAKGAQNHYNYETCPCEEPYGDCIPNLWGQSGEPAPHGQGNAA